MFCRFRFVLVAGLMALALFGASGVAFAASEGESHPWVGREAPDFILPDLEGNQVRLSNETRKGLVWLNFWGIRCGPCVRELPALAKIYNTYKDKGLNIIGINVDGVDVDFIKKSFAQREDLSSAGIKFPLVADTELAVLDSYELMGAPLNVMIDKKGIVRYYHENYEDGDEVLYEQVIKKLLAE